MVFSFSSEFRISSKWVCGTQGNSDPRTLYHGWWFAKKQLKLLYAFKCSVGLISTSLPLKIKERRGPDRCVWTEISRALVFVVYQTATPWAYPRTEKTVEQVIQMSHDHWTRCTADKVVWTDCFSWMPVTLCKLAHCWLHKVVVQISLVLHTIGYMALCYYVMCVGHNKMF